jgi:hypothetical protein
MGVDRARNFALGRSPAGVDVKLQLRRSDRACACVMLFQLFRNGSGAASSARAFVAPKDVGSTGGAGIESLASCAGPSARQSSAPHGKHNALPTAG